MNRESHKAKAAFQGDRDAFVHLVRNHQKKAYTIAYRLLRNRESAQDLVQEAFIRAFKNRERYDPHRPFGPWLYRIVTNLCLNERKRKHALPSAVLEPPDFGQDPSLLAQAKYKTTRLQAAVDTLKEHYRAPFILRYVENNSCREVATILGCPVNTVKIRLHRARELLRQRLRNLREGKENCHE